MGARRYDPVLGRFISADTIIPNPGNPLDMDRFAYVRNNPLKYTDPTGHILCDSAYEECDASDPVAREERIKTIKWIKIMKEVNRLFDPFTGALPDYVEYSGSTHEDFDKNLEDEYVQHNINLEDLAKGPTSNPVTEDMLLDWKYISSDNVIGRIYLTNRVHEPYTIFLVYLGLPIDAETHWMNYESNYLNALMTNEQNQEALYNAKKYYIQYAMMQIDYELKEKLFGEGIPFGSWHD